MKGRVCAMLLTAALCLGLMPANVLAAADDAEVEGIVAEETDDDSVIIEDDDDEIIISEGEDETIEVESDSDEDEIIEDEISTLSIKEEEEEPEEEASEPKEYIFEGNTVDVTAILPADSDVPSDAELKVTSVDEENEDYDYDDLMEKADDVNMDGKIGEILFYDISFYSSDGDYLKVDDKATVTIKFKENVFPGEGSTHILHFDSKNDNKAKDITGVEKKQNDDGDVTEVDFKTDGFSVFAVADVVPLAEGDADLYINYAHIDLGYSGTAPFDEGSNNTDGNDENAENNIIRSFDRAGYDMTVDIDSKSEQSDVTAVRIWFELNIEGNDIENEFYTQGFPWVDHYELADTDTGHKITGYYDYKDDAGVTASQKSGMSMVVQVLAMTDGSTLKPTGKVWLEELDEDGNGTNALSEPVELEFPELEISAKLMMNVYLGQGTEAESSVEGSFNFDTADLGYLNYGLGNVNGRLFGYGIDLELYDKETGKGMKGQALPSGDTITITVNLNSTYKVDNDTSESYAGQTLNLGEFEDGNYQLLFYALEGNVNSGVTCTDGRTLQSNEGYSPTYPYSRTVCWNKSTASTLGTVAAENGGSWKAVNQDVSADGTTITIEISSYEITKLMFPYAKTSNSSIYYYYDEGTALEEIERAAFSAAELWVVQPYDYTDEDGNVHELLYDAGKGTFTLNVKDGVVDGVAGTYASASYNSLDGDAVDGEKAVDTQVYSGDDSYSQSAYIDPPGSFKNRIKYNDNVTSWNNVQSVEVNDGTSYATLGQDDFYITSGFSWTANTVRNTMAAANALMKFDASALAIDQAQQKLRSPSFTGLDINAVTTFYGYLPSGENWESDSQMQAADEDDLNWYSTIQEGQTCVAVLYEYRQPATVPTIIYYFPATQMRVLTDDDISGNVYMTCEVTRLWTVSDVAEVYNKANNTSITYSDVLNDTNGSQYVKASIPSVADNYGSTENLPEASEGYGNAGDYNTPTVGSEYVKVQYDNGSHTGHTGDIQYGDSLLILDYTSRVDISVAQEATDQQTGDTVAKSIYNFDNLERVADLVVTGGIDIENGVETESWGDTITTIAVTLPDGATYIPNSAQYGVVNSDGTFDITYTQSNPLGQQGTISGGSGFTQTTSEAEYEAWLADDSATGGMLYISTGADGNTVLTFSVKGVPIQGTDVVKIYFSVELGDESDPEKDLETNSSLSFDATISTTEDNDRAMSGANGNEDNTTILVTETGSNTFSKYAVNELTEVNEDLSWIIKWDNTSNDEAAMCEILDDMPDTNEAMGIYQSDYHGTYAINGFQIDLSEIPSADLENLTVYYTTDPAFDGDEFVLEHDEQTGETIREISWEEITTEWDKLNISDDGTVDFSTVYEYEYDTEGKITGVTNHVYAWAIGGYVPAGEGVHITLTIHQYGAQGGDYMTNVAYDSTGSSVFHRAATIYRALRTISGTVWLDEDMDGGIDTGVYGNEQKINGVQVQLQVWNDDTGKWENADDVYGENFEIITQLDPKGYYEFTNLGAGTYRVLFADDETGKYEQPYMLSEHTLTECEALGIPEAYNSKAKAYESNSIWPFAADDYQGVISDIELPALDEMTVYDYVYEVPYQNAGYIKPQELDVTKTWIDADGNKITSIHGTTEISAEITVKTGYAEDATKWSVALNEENSWKDTIEDLFYYDGNGTKLKYELDENITVTEDGVPVRYELNDEYPRLTEKDDGSYIIELENDEVTTEIDVEKVWKGDEGYEDYRPKITVKLLADGTDTGKTLTLNEANDWKGIFTNLPVYNDDDEEIEYTVEEVEIDDYNTEITKNTVTNEDGMTTVSFTITNTMIEPKMTKSVAEDDYERKEESGEHMHEGEDTDGGGWGTWDDADNNQEVTYHLTLTELSNVRNLVVHDYLQDGLDFEPETVEITLYTAENVSKTLVENEDYTVTQDACSDPYCTMDGCTFEVKFTDDEDHKPFENLPEGSYMVITYKALTETHEADYEGYEDDLVNSSYMTYGASTTFLRRSAVVYAETDLFGFGVYKYAIEDGEEFILADAEFILERDDVYATFESETDEDTGEVYYMVSGWVEDKDSADTLITDADGMIRIEGLDDDTYTLIETKAPEGYQIIDESMTVVIDEDGNVTVDGNTGEKEAVVEHVVNVQNVNTLTEISGFKTWDDSDDQDGKRPESITVNLLADGEVIDTKTVTAEDDWKWSFTDLPEYNKGVKIQYSVTEEKVDDYSTEYSDDGEIINSYTPGQTSLTVVKVWNDENDADDIRPESIVVKLLKNGDETGQTVVLTADNNWTGSFTELDEYTDGKLNTYTVQENDAEGYTAEISGNQTDGYVITNTHEPEKETPETGTPGPGPANGGNGPKTGDTNNIGLWLALLAAAVVAVFAAIRMRKRS